MIDNIRTGQNIAAHRQRLGWTQGELAGRLNVTHQAVSKWENGAAFPDISTLYALAQLFGISMEQLLTGKPISAVSAENDAPAISEASPSPDETVSIHDSDSSKTDIPASDAASDSENPYSWDEIISLAPFASRETLERIIDACIEECALDHLVALAPFISRRTLDILAERAISDEDWSDILPALAPFLSRETLGRLIDLHMDGSIHLHQIAAFAPFLSRQTLDQLIRSAQDSADWNQITALAPFASRETLKNLVEQCSSPCNRSHLSAIAPFLDRRTLDNLILNSIRPASPVSQPTDSNRRNQEEDRLAAWSEAREKEMDNLAAWADAHEKEIEREARRAERRAERMEEKMIRQAEKFSEKLSRKTVQLDPASSADSKCLTDDRRTQIVQPDPQAGSLETYAERIVSLLYEAFDADEPFCEQLEDLRNALLYKDYPALNDFAALLDEHIGPQWLEEYAVLCDQSAPDKDFSHHLELALAQRDWNWIEDHSHLISDPETIRRLILLSTTEGFFEFVPLFIDQLDQHSIDSAARQAVRLNQTDDILCFADRVSPGIL